MLTPGTGKNILSAKRRLYSRSPIEEEITLDSWDGMVFCRRDHLLGHSSLIIPTYLALNPEIPRTNPTRILPNLMLVAWASHINRVSILFDPLIVVNFLYCVEYYYTSVLIG
jgi:hypothetical protein